MDKKLAEKLRDISVAKFEKIQEFIEYDDLELAALELAMSETCGYCQEFAKIEDVVPYVVIKNCTGCPVLSLAENYFDSIRQPHNRLKCTHLFVFKDLTDALNADEQMASMIAVGKVIEFIKGPLFEKSLEEKTHEEELGKM